MPFKPKNSRFYHYDFQIRGRRFHGSCGTEDHEEAKSVEANARVAAKAQQVEKGDTPFQKPSARTTGTCHSIKAMRRPR